MTVAKSIAVCNNNWEWQIVEAETCVYHVKFYLIDLPSDLYYKTHISW